ncbi:hypothetical protein [Nocardia salmonicida]|uniref:hypothetical protein n=1 Tax=Nocardia salmonicida TaxID=53431 RepID=UPI003626BC6F
MADYDFMREVQAVQAQAAREGSDRERADGLGHQVLDGFVGALQTHRLAPIAIFATNWELGAERYGFPRRMERSVRTTTYTLVGYGWPMSFWSTGSEHDSNDCYVPEIGTFCVELAPAPLPGKSESISKSSGSYKDITIAPQEIPQLLVPSWALAASLTDRPQIAYKEGSGFVPGARELGTNDAYRARLTRFTAELLRRVQH